MRSISGWPSAVKSASGTFNSCLFRLAPANHGSNKQRVPQFRRQRSRERLAQLRIKHASGCCHLFNGAMLALFAQENPAQLNVKSVQESHAAGLLPGSRVAVLAVESCNKLLGKCKLFCVLRPNLGDVLRPEVIDPPVTQNTRKTTVGNLQQNEAQARRRQSASNPEVALSQPADPRIDKQLVELNQ